MSVNIVIQIVQFASALSREVTLISSTEVAGGTTRSDESGKHTSAASFSSGQVNVCVLIVNSALEACDDWTIRAGCLDLVKAS